MPINFQQAVEQIRKMGSSARQRAAALDELRELARALLREMAGQEDYLLELAEEAARKNPRLRAGLPASGRLDAALNAAELTQTCVIFAADGSQINPDRHAPVEFGAINVGAICFRPGSAPRETVDSRLLFYEDLYIGTAPLTEDVVALMRDLAERQLLFSLAKPERESGAPVVTLTDGPLELYGEDQNSANFKEKLDDYLEVLRSLARTGAAAAGYVDKPRSSYIINLLELVLLKRLGSLDKAGQEHPLFPVHDGDLYLPILQPGQRTAIFALRSSSAARFKGELALHFFYINVGRAGKSQIARVEIPHWVAETPDLLAQLHNALLEQSKQMGARPYPYILHRAHEVAVVSFEEKDQLEAMIQAELRKQGVDPGEASNKQSSKDLPGRTRK
jgi:hypothetical protein